MKSLYILLLLSCIAIVSCKDLKNMPGSYEVVNVNGIDRANKGVTLNINVVEGEYRIAGNNGCNSYGGSFTVDKDQVIEIGPVMATKMYCEDNADVEREYMAALDNVHHAKLNKDSLELMDVEGNVIVTAKRINE